ncbi:MAG: hypothetical protein GF381_04160 [Candidatus Pacebacteria bacterium]|nr:hypothetical protein [Candidatus Paceibacterota bacterium]
MTDFKRLSIFLVGAIILLLSANHVLAGPPPIPEPPDQETLDRLYELGRENELKYGSGQVAPTANPSPNPSPMPTTMVSPTMTVAPSPITTLTPAPTPTEKSKELARSTKPTQPSFIRAVFNQFKNWLRWLVQLLPNQKEVQVVIEEKPKVSPTPEADTSKAEEYYWQGFDIWVKTKDYEKSSQYYRQALEADPDFAPALSSLGYIRAVFYD